MEGVAMKAYLLIASAACFLCAAGRAGEAVFLHTASITSNGKEVKPEYYISPAPRNWETTKNGLIRIDDTGVFAMKGNQELWMAKFPQDCAGQMLRTTNDFAFVQFWKKADKDGKQEYV